MTIGVTYTALVIGELGPKHIALSNPEAIAICVARPLTFVASAAAPLIWLLSGSTSALLRLYVCLRAWSARRPRMTFTTSSRRALD